MRTAGTAGAIAAGAILCAVAPVSGAEAALQTSAIAQPPGSVDPGSQDGSSGDPAAATDGEQAPPPGSGLPGDPATPGATAGGDEAVPPVVLTGPISAWGDTLEQSNLVLSRPRPGLDPQGIRLGSFTLFPSVNAAAGYEDNIFETQGGKVGSATIAITPSLQLSRQSPGSSLSLQADGLIQRYASAARANYAQYEFKGAGAIDLSPALALQAGAYYDRQAEPRGSAGDTSSNGRPVLYTNPGANFELLAGTGPLQLRAGGTFDRYAYDSLRIGDTRVSQRFRDRNSYAGHVQAGVEIGPGLLAFVNAALDRQRYDLRGAAAIPDSRGYSVLGGVDFRITKLLRGRIGAGYLWRDYSEGYTSLGGFTYDASLVWNVTTLVALTAKAAKTVEESPSIGSSGIIANTFSLGVDWEFIRKIILSAKLDYTREKYRTVSRIDHRVEPSFVVQYLAGRYVEFNASYTYHHQFGQDVLARRYKDNVIQVGMTLKK